MCVCAPVHAYMPFLCVRSPAVGTHSVSSAKENRSSTNFIATYFVYLSITTLCLLNAHTHTQQKASQQQQLVRCPSTTIFFLFFFSLIYGKST